MHVHREAYYGGTFTGNHAHKCLKVNYGTETCGYAILITSTHKFQAVNVDTISASIPKVASERCPEMEDAADAVASKYGRVFLLFSKCHVKLNSQDHFTQSDIATLRKLTNLNKAVIVYLMQKVILTIFFPSTDLHFLLLLLHLNFICLKTT